MKKILSLLSVVMLLSVIAGNAQTVRMLTNKDKRTYYYNNVAAMQADYSHIQDSSQIITSGYYTPGDGGGNKYIYYASSSAVVDGGSVISMPTGRCLASFENDVHVKQFGAKADGSESQMPYLGTNNTTFFQNALNYADKLTSARKKVIFDDGTYLLDSINVLSGLHVEGKGAIEMYGRGGTKLLQTRGISRSLVYLYDTIVYAQGQPEWAYLSFRDVGLQGDTANTSANNWAISWRKPDGTPCAPQDMNDITDVIARYFAGGGFEYPTGGISILVSHCRFLFNGGYGGVYIKEPGGHTSQSIMLINLAGDGLSNGLVFLDSLHKETNVTALNLKYENADGNPFANPRRGSFFPFIIKDCDSTAITVIGGNTVSSVDTTAGVYIKPGSFFSVIGTARMPKILWEGITFTVGGTQLGNDPNIIDGNQDFGYKTAFGMFPAVSKIFTAGTFTEYNKNADAINNKEYARDFWDATTSSMWRLTNESGTGTFARGVGMGVQGTAGSLSLTNAQYFRVNLLPSTSAGRFEFSGSATSGNGNFISLTQTLQSSTGTQNMLGLFGSANQSSAGAFRGFLVSLLPTSFGSATIHNALDIGTNTLANGSGTHTSYASIDLYGNAFFKGRVSMGTITPDTTTATLSLTGDATHPPLKLANNTLITTPVNNTIENDGTRPQYTNNTGSRTGVALLSDISGTASTPSIVTEANLGSAVKAESVPLANVNSSLTFASASYRIFAITVTSAQTVTGIRWFQTVQGSYTAASENRIGIYSQSAGTGTLVASTADDGTIWSTAASNTWANKDLSAPISLSAGTYYVVMLYNTSAQTTAPAIGAQSIQNSTLYNLDFPNGNKLSASKTSVTTLPATITMSAVTGGSLMPYVEFY